ncbi:hypothetical protein [Anaerotruncus colihominis]
MNGRAGEFLHLVRHFAKGNIHYILDFRNITAKLNRFFAKLDDFMGSKRTGDNSSQFFGSGGHSVQPILDGLQAAKRLFGVGGYVNNNAAVRTCHDVTVLFGLTFSLGAFTISSYSDNRRISHET